MAKNRFSAEAYRTANKKAEGNENDFPTVANGIYIVTLEKAFFKDNPETQSQNANLHFQISSDDENHKNAYIFYMQNLVKGDGSNNEIGLVAFNRILLAMSENTLAVDDFIENPDEELEKFIFTELRIKFSSKPSNNPKFRNQKIEVLSVLNNKYSGKASVTPTEESLFEDEPDVVEEVDENEVEIEVGDRVAYNLKGKVYPSTIVAFIDGKNGKAGQLLIIPDKTGKERTVNEADCDFLEKVAAPSLESEEKETIEEEEEELEEEATIEVGSAVSSVFNKEMFDGIVRAIDEDTGIVKIAYNGKLRKCKLENTVLV